MAEADEGPILVVEIIKRLYVSPVLHLQGRFFVV